MVDFDRWAEDFAAEMVRKNPQLATAAQYFADKEQEALDADLALSNQWGIVYGKGAAEKLAALAAKGRAALGSFQTSDLTAVQQTSAAALRWFLDDAIANARFGRHRFVFSQIFGFHVLNVGFLAATHPMRNPRDAENYLVRLRRLPEILDEGSAEARAAALEGIVPPRFILERTIEQLDALAAGPAAQHVLVASLVARMRLASFASGAAADFAARACEEVEGRVLPAFARVRETLRGQLPASSDEAGAWALPDGQAYYARQLASATGTTLSALEIHELGLREVERIESELGKVLRKLGHTNGTIAERLSLLNESFAVTGPDPRQTILQDLQAIIDDAARRARTTFALVPKAPVEVRREPEFSERSSAAHYTVPAPDGSTPGIYWVPLADLSPSVPWIGIALKSTAYHEAIPGHHFQLAIEQESSTLPYFRKRGALGYNPAFNEGWALYAERLCAESGWYDGDLPGYAGYLQQQLFRARRLVVDTGMHELRWSRERAIAYGFTAAEVERYASWPGQACAYAIGQLRILELREAAKAKLGARFDVKAFHDSILSGGTLPLDVLATTVERWAERQSTSTSQRR